MSLVGDRLKDAVAALLGVSAYQPYRGFGPELDDKNVKQTREALGGQIQPLPQTRLRWYLADLESAQHEADAGNITMAAQLYRAMRRDGVLHGLLGARAAGLVRLPKKFYGDTEICGALRFGNGTRSVFDELMPPAETGMIVEDGIVLGVSLGELVPVQGRPFPVLVRLEPEFLQYRWYENRWYFHSIAGVLPITPGDGRWVLHMPGPRMSPWHFGLWPALGRSFINKEHALMHRANYSAKLANPARAAVAPRGAVEEERRGFLRRLISWGINTVFELPPGWDVKLIESNGRGYDVFQREIDTSDHEYMVALAGQEVTTTGGAGFSNAEFPYRIREDLTEQDGEALAYTVNTQVLPSFIATNYGGPEAIDTRTTNVQWETGRPKELKDQADTLLKTAQAIVALKQALDAAGRTLDIDAICERFAVALTTGEAPEARSDDPEEKTPAAPTLQTSTPGVKPVPGEATPEGKAAAAALGYTPLNGAH